jgi:ADP-ribosylglycohydrolase
MASDEFDRAYGALLGLAIGDALGMPTQGFERAEVAARWATSGGEVAGFGAAPDDNPISAGLPAGRVTDDTEQAVILARLLIDGRGHVDPYDFAAALTQWQDDKIAAGSADLLGPSTNRAIAAIRAGTPPGDAGRDGRTNGAAMRICPVGIAVPPRPLERLVDAVTEASRVTHNTGTAISGAAAIAAAVSAGIDGCPQDEVIDLAVAAARLGERGGATAADQPVADKIASAVSLGRGADITSPAGRRALLDRITSNIGSSLATEESVPAAFAVAGASWSDPWLACRLAASLGGDSDTIAAMTGAILGATSGRAGFPPSAAAAMLAANPELDLSALARQLLGLRSDQGLT